jgi:plastocyanin
MTGRRPLWIALGLIAAGVAILLIGVVAGGISTAEHDDVNGLGPGSMMGGGAGDEALPDPAVPGFVPGTASDPRVVRIEATAQLRFVPDVVPVKAGETITFEVTTVGPVTHEFMVGPAADVAADRPGTPEVADIGMMETRSITYTFDGPGPYAFACHAPGHYEAGMAGTIVLVP